MKTHDGREGFTIIELLVVIGILALLVGLLLPALSGAQKKSLKNSEMNSLRQIGLGWNLYANSSQDKLLPGYLQDLVQADWRVSYDFMDGSTMPAALAQAWTWRLLPYLDYNHKMVHGYRDEPDFNPTLLNRDNVINMPEIADEALAIAEQPAFGYNAYYCGGWWEMEGDVPRYRFYDATVADDKYVNVVVRSVSTIRRSSDLIIFCSSARLPGDGIYRKFPNDIPGSHVVVPPYLGDVQQWASSWGNPGGAEGFGPSADVAQHQSPDTGPPTLTWGELDPNTLRTKIETTPPIGRYNALAATLYADGHTDTNKPGALMDMRKWIDSAPSGFFRHR